MNTGNHHRTLAFPNQERCAAERLRDHEGRRACAGRSRLAYGIVIVRWVVLGAAVLMLTACAGGTHLSFLNPQGPVTDAQRWHFYWVLGIMAVLVAGPIFLLTPFWAWRHRYGAKNSRYTPNWKFSRLLEITAWGGPIVIVGVLAFFVWRNAHKLDPYKPLASDQPALRVQVIGYDWKWLFIMVAGTIWIMASLAPRMTLPMQPL